MTTKPTKLRTEAGSLLQRMFSLIVDGANSPQLTDEQNALFKSEMKKKRKSGFKAFILWFFLGLFGAHTFYLGKTKIGILRLFLFFFFMNRINTDGTQDNMVTILGTTGYVLWTFVDVFFLRNMLRECNEKIEESIINDILTADGVSPSAAGEHIYQPDPADRDDTPVKEYPESEELIRDMQFKMQTLIRLYSETADRSLQREIREVHAALESVLSFIMENPGCALQTRKLTQTYLSGVIDLLNNYIPIERRDIMSEETAQSRQQVEISLDGVESYAKDVLKNLYQMKHNEIRDNSEVLNRSLQMDGTPVFNKKRNS